MLHVIVTNGIASEGDEDHSPRDLLAVLTCAKRKLDARNITIAVRDVPTHTNVPKVGDKTREHFSRGAIVELNPLYPGLGDVDGEVICAALGAATEDVKGADDESVAVAMREVHPSSGEVHISVRVEVWNDYEIRSCFTVRKRGWLGGR